MLPCRNEADRFRLMVVNQREEIEKLEEDAQRREEVLEGDVEREKEAFLTSQSCISELQERLRELEAEKMALQEEITRAKASSTLNKAMEEERGDEEQRKRAREQEEEKGAKAWQQALEAREEDLVRTNSQLSALLLERKEEIDRLKRERDQVVAKLAKGERGEEGGGEGGEALSQLLAEARLKEESLETDLLAARRGRDTLESELGRLTEAHMQQERVWGEERESLRRDSNQKAREIGDLTAAREGLLEQLRQRTRELRSLREEKEVLTLRLEEVLKERGREQLGPGLGLDEESGLLASSSSNHHQQHQQQVC